MSITFYSGPDTQTLDRELPEVNFANGNACAVLSAMGLRPDPYGVVGVSDLLRGIMRAQNSDRSVNQNTREAEQYGGPGTGVCRVVVSGLDTDGIRRRVSEIAKFVEAVQAKGYRFVWWG